MIFVIYRPRFCPFVHFVIVLYCIYAFWVVSTREINLRSTITTVGSHKDKRLLKFGESTISKVPAELRRIYCIADSNPWKDMQMWLNLRATTKGQMACLDSVSVCLELDRSQFLSHLHLRKRISQSSWLDYLEERRSLLHV